MVTDFLFIKANSNLGNSILPRENGAPRQRRLPKKATCLFLSAPPVGPTNLCLEKSAVGRGLAAIRGLGGIQPLFILYLMRRFENEIASRGTGTTFNAITGNQLKTFKIPLPPLTEQTPYCRETGKAVCTIGRSS